MGWLHKTKERPKPSVASAKITPSFLLILSPPWKSKINKPYKSTRNNLSLSLCLAMAEMEELTSGASGRIIPLFKNIRQRSTVLSYDSLRRSLLFIQSIFFWFLLVLPRTKPSSSAASSPAKRRRKEEEDTLRRRALAQDFPMLDETDDGAGRCESATSLFYGVRRNALFVRSWFPVTGELKYVSSANSLIHVISFGVFFFYFTVVILKPLRIFLYTFHIF